MTLRIKMLVLQVIGKLDIFPLMCALIKSGSLNWPWSTKILGHFVTHMPKNWLSYWKVWLQTHFDITDKNNNASFEDLDIHYHSSSLGQTCCDTSNNVCLNLQTAVILYME
jgi:hypothetical protein